MAASSATGINGQSQWNSLLSDSDWRMLNTSNEPPPPIPARNQSHSRLVFNAIPPPSDNNADTYLTPVTNSHLEPVILPVSRVNPGPPLPARHPLQRSVSLTHRPLPIPTDDQQLPLSSPDNQQQVALSEIINAWRLARSGRPAQLTPAASAPLLNQVVPVSHWPRQEPNAEPASPIRIIPLPRWPLADTSSTTRHLAMDSFVSRGGVSSSNEYVEGPCSAAVDGCRHRRRNRRKVTIPQPTNSTIAVPTDAARNSNGLVEIATSNRPVTASNSSSSRRSGFRSKLRRFLSCGGDSTDEVEEEAADESRDFCQFHASSSGNDSDISGTVCRRCGQCRCPECLRTEESASLCRSRAVVDTVTCMCCVRSVFYHCLKDDTGQDDYCSDTPCACCEQPHCPIRWTIMALLLPCLPCLCLYPPLNCTVTAICRRRHAARTGCRCSCRSRSPGLKGLLESESSSA